MDTERGVLNTGVYRGKRGEPVGGGGGEGLPGEKYQMWVRGESKQNTLPCVYLCNCIACSAHVPQNLKCNKKTKTNKQKEITKIRAELKEIET